MTAIYNELDPYAAQWLCNLIAAGHIADGAVDDRSISDLVPADVAGPGQRHFFAGIGGWSHALRLAGIADDADIWTGSCPCQPFSAAGRGLGTSDPRHLWPEWFRLIRECRPAIVLGEQVASPAGLGWFDTVHTDLDGEGYAVGAADLCAAGVGAPHIRQRLYFVAVAGGQRRQGVGVQLQGRGPERGLSQADRRGKAGELGNSMREGERGHAGAASRAKTPSNRQRGKHGNVGDRSIASSAVDWSSCDWLPCSDGVQRPVEPGAFPLAHGVPARVGKLRAYGNAIVPQVAAAFIRAVLA
jgi:DNA (cytosine-5)-methyltransferase 1